MSRSPMNDENLSDYPNKTTKEMLQKDICYCNHKEEVIRIIDCELFNGCRFDKACRSKSMKDYEDSIKGNSGISVVRNVST